MTSELQPSEPLRDGDLVLALHSCTETLAVGVQSLEAGSGGAPTPAVATFPLGRALSNEILDCVESILPASAWPRLRRLAVATGPGGFTGTRLTVVLARTLAQQLQLPLDGFSDFLLMARGVRASQEFQSTTRFWMVREQPRRGIVAGLYDWDHPSGTVIESRPPRLFADRAELSSIAEADHVPAVSRLPEDLLELLRLSRAAAAVARPAPWQTVLPIYPTSPVDRAGAGTSLQGVG